MRFQPSRVAVVFCVLGFAACFRNPNTPEPTLLYDIRVKLPLDHHANQVCEHTCDELTHEGTTGYVECIARCDGAEIADRAACDPQDHRPTAICYEVRARVEGADDGVLASLIVDSIVTAGSAVTNVVTKANRK